MFILQHFDIAFAQHFIGYFYTSVNTICNMH